MERPEEFTSTYPSPKAKTWERKRDGMNTLRNSAEKMPPFFMAPLFLMLRDAERLGCRKWNSLGTRWRGRHQRSLADKTWWPGGPPPAAVGPARASAEKTRMWTYLGGMFSGRLDQSDTQSTLFFKASTSFSPSAASSSDYKEEFKI